MPVRRKNKATLRYATARNDGHQTKARRMRLYVKSGVMLPNDLPAIQPVAKRSSASGYVGRLGRGALSLGARCL